MLSHCAILREDRATVLTSIRHPRSMPSMSAPGPDRDARLHTPGVRVGMAIGFTLIATVIGVTLSSSPPVLAGTNSITAQRPVGETSGDARRCQNGEVVPVGTTAIRTWITGYVLPSVGVKVLARSQVITHGSRAGGWRGQVVTIPATRVPHTILDATICITLGEGVRLTV